MNTFKEEIINKINEYKSITKVAKFYNVQVYELIEFLDSDYSKLTNNKKREEINKIKELHSNIWGHFG